MRRVKAKDTAPELAVRKALTRLGARYRLHRKDLPGKPDIVMPGRRLAVFVHGCFWHGHDCARGARVPTQNRDYWLAKVARNRARDEDNRAALVAADWQVETIWECEIKSVSNWATRLGYPATPSRSPLTTGAGAPRRCRNRSGRKGGSSACADRL